MQNNIKINAVVSQGTPQNTMQNIFDNFSQEDKQPKQQSNPQKQRLTIKKRQQEHPMSYSAIASTPPMPQQKLSRMDAEKFVFPIPWYVWIHKNSSKNWTLSGYDRIMKISNITDFWNFINNFNKINYMDYQIFIMKENITPIWESPENENGGAASLRLKLSDKNLLRIWEDMCLYTLNDQICTLPMQVNGISFNLKNDLTVIKVWNKDRTIDISKKISRTLMCKYKSYSFVYIKNRPGL